MEETIQSYLQIFSYFRHRTHEMPDWHRPAKPTLSMALFQQSVIKKYIGNLDEHALKAAWLQYQAHFHNAHIQENIWDAKEEEYQEGFVMDLFSADAGVHLFNGPTLQPLHADAWCFHQHRNPFFLVHMIALESV